MTPRIIKLIAEIDEFKGYWKGMATLNVDFLSDLRIIATIESIGASTRIEGAKLSDSEVSALLKGIGVRSFRSRDEQEVAGYAEALQRVQDSYGEIDLTENNIKYLHKVLLKFSDKDAWHLGEYKKHPNHVAAFDPDGREIGILFETASPFDTPQMMEFLVTETRKNLKDHLLKKIEREKIAHALPDMSVQILNLAREHGRVTVSFVTNVLQVNRNTVKKHLQHLVRTEKLVLHGKGRGSYYAPFTREY